MPQFNFTGPKTKASLCMPNDVEIHGDEVTLIFDQQVQAQNFVANCGMRGGYEIKDNKKIVISRPPSGQEEYVKELIKYYNDRGKKNKREVTLACIAIACLDRFLDPDLSNLLIDPQERKKFIAIACDSSWYQRGLGDIVQQKYPFLKRLSDEKAVGSFPIADLASQHASGNVAVAHASAATITAAIAIPVALPTTAMPVAVQSHVTDVKAFDLPATPAAPQTVVATDVKSSDLKLVDTQALLKLAQAELSAHETQCSRQFPYPDKILSSSEQTTAEKIISRPLTVTKESILNKKDTPTPNQDSTDAKLEDMPAGTTPATVMDAVKATTKLISEQLRVEFPDSGTTFTACAIGNFSGRLVATCAQLGDSGACKVKSDAKDGETAEALTPSHNICSNSALLKLLQSPYKNNLVYLHKSHLSNSKGYFFANGHNFHKLKILPVIRTDYLGSYVFIEKSSPELYYINHDAKEEAIVIKDAEKFVSALKVIDENPYTAKTIFRGAKLGDVNIWEVVHNIPSTSLHLSERQLHDLLTHTSRPTTAGYDQVEFLGNLRFLGNGSFAHCGSVYEPECTQLEIDPNDKIILFTDGLTDRLKLSSIPKFIQFGCSIGMQARLRGSKDDITTLIATELNKLPPGKILLLIIADGHCANGHLVSQAAVKLFKENFCKQLGITAENVIVAVVPHAPLTAGQLRNAFVAHPAPSPAAAPEIAVHPATAPGVATTPAAIDKTNPTNPPSPS